MNSAKTSKKNYFFFLSVSQCTNTVDLEAVAHTYIDNREKEVEDLDIREKQLAKSYRKNVLLFYPRPALSEGTF